MAWEYATDIFFRQAFDCRCCKYFASCRRLLPGSNYPKSIAGQFDCIFCFSVFFFIWKQKIHAQCCPHNIKILLFLVFHGRNQLFHRIFFQLFKHSPIFHLNLALPIDSQYRNFIIEFSVKRAGHAMIISLIVPTCNKEDAVTIFQHAIKSNRELAAYDMKIIFVNDGSTDTTAQVVKEILQVEANIKLINFSRNFGKETAPFSVLQHAQGHVVIPIDVDLQDHIEVIPRLIEKYLDGAEVILAKRVDRASDSWMKRRMAEAFYWFHNKISKSETENNVGDFRPMSRKVVNEIIKLEETQIFMKGILSWVDFSTEIVEYTREKRVISNTKFNAWKLWNLAIESITCSSTVSLKT